MELLIILPKSSLGRLVCFLLTEMFYELNKALGSLFQGSVTLRGKKFFLMFRRNFLCLSLCPLPLDKLIVFI